MMKALTRDQRRMIDQVAEVTRQQARGLRVVAQFGIHSYLGFQVDFTVHESFDCPKDTVFTEHPSLCGIDDITIYRSEMNDGCIYCGGAVNVFWADRYWFEINMQNANYYSMVYNHTNKEWFFYPLLREALLDVPEPSKALSYEECEVIEESFRA
jgi:hypothetical protein